MSYTIVKPKSLKGGTEAMRIIYWSSTPKQRRQVVGKVAHEMFNVDAGQPLTKDQRRQADAAVRQYIRGDE